ncbi:MAG TPA: DNA recombination protein RmuC [Rhodospirillales bacterium]|jgi:DNA recombination protein RmuC|nr:DNA recombination protein RmuC [Rhodospirillales bacterium]
MNETFLILAAAAAIFVIVLVALLRSERARAEAAMRLARLTETAENLAAAQAQLVGRQEQAQSGVNERLDALAKRLGDSLSEQMEKTGERLRTLHERLAVIDAAQKNITDLSERMVGLQDILSNKQARGAFGEIQLNDLVAGILPPSAFGTQVTLSNGKRADCLIKLPNPPGAIVIDAKFPLESYYILRQAKNEAAQKKALREFGAAIMVHVGDIAGKYIVPGETAESALMFLPSEAVYAELHASLPGIVERSHRSKVWIVSPTTLMATLNTVRAVLKDVRMREQAGVIQVEVLKMLEDVARLDKRVENLEGHFNLAAKDISQIGTSAKKIVGRGEKIQDVQIGDDAPAEPEGLPPPE